MRKGKDFGTMKDFVVLQTAMHRRFLGSNGKRREAIKGKRGQNGTRNVYISEDTFKIGCCGGQKKNPLTGAAATDEAR